MKILTIDQGNSSLKCIIWVDGNPDKRFKIKDGNFEMLSSCLKSENIDGISLSTVAAGKELQTLLEKEAIGVKILEVSALMDLPFRLDYITPNTLGADRIAAIAGASSLRPGKASLVVDIGTAMTLDVCDAQGNFLGGNISPGLYLRFKSLHEETGALPMIESEGPIPLLGFDTATAIRSGVVRGIASEIIQTFRGVAADHGCDNVILTGMNAEIFIPILEFNNISITYDPDLVGRGLLKLFLYTSGFEGFS